MENINFTGRVAIVTGSGQGIGRMYALGMFEYLEPLLNYTELIL